MSFRFGLDCAPNSHEKGRPCPSDLRIKTRQFACGLLKPAGFLPALLLVVAACRSSIWPPEDLTNIAGPHSQFKYITAGRTSYLTTNSQLNCKKKHLKTLNPASHG